MKIPKKMVPLLTLGIIVAITCIFKEHIYLPTQPDLTVIGFVNMSDGLGRQSVELIKSLKDEIKVNFIPTSHSVMRNTPKEIRDIITVKNLHPQMGKVIIYEKVLCFPGRSPGSILKKLSSHSGIKIAYSMFESSEIPHEWVFLLNKHFDAVAVPDKFLVKIYQDSGVRIPIFTLPLGLYLDNFLKQPLKKNRHLPMVFANLGTPAPRKNQITLIQAFAKAFGNNPDVLLRINCRYGKKNEFEILEKEIQQAGVNNIVLTKDNLDGDAYLDLFKEVDCYVSLSKGEGFSIQPREALALGIPTIVTDNTGQSTICQSGLVKVVPSKLVEPALYSWGMYHGNFYNCQVQDVVLALKDVYRNYGRHLKKSQKAREWVKQYEYKNLAELYLTLAKPKMVRLGQENTVENGVLTTNSPELFEKYKTVIDQKD